MEVDSPTPSRRKQSSSGYLLSASVLGADKDTYEGLEYWVPFNDERRNDIKSKEIKSGSDIAVKWCLFALIGFVVALISVVMKQSVERVVLFRFDMIHTILDPEEHHSHSDSNETSASGSIDSPNYATAWLFWVCTSCLLAFLSSVIIVFVEPKASGSGLPEVMAYLNGVQLSRTFSLKVMGVKFLSCLLAVSSGLPVGPEGPMIHLGSMVGAFLTQKKHENKGVSEFVNSKLQPFRNTADRISFMTCGAAAGVSAAFGAPVGGLLFVMEEISSYWDQRLTWMIFFSTMIAFYSVVCFNTVVHGWYPTGYTFGELAEDAQVLFQPEIMSKVHMNLMIIFPASIIGLACGLAGVLFTRWNVRVNKWRRGFIKKHRLRQVLEPVVLALVFGTLSFVFPLISTCDVVPSGSGDGTHVKADHEVKGANHNDFAQFVCSGEDSYSPLATLTLNSGENAIRHLYSKGTRGQFQSGALLSFFALYFTLSGYASGAAYATGIVIPMLVMGATIGRLLGEFTHSLVPAFDNYDWFDPGIFALVGSASLFAGVSRLTVSLAVIMLEISHEVYFLPPMMVAIMISKCLADYLEPHSLYHQMIHLNNVPFLEPLDFLHAPRYELLPARAAMSKTVLSLRQTDTVGNVFVCLGSTHNAFPVVNEKSELRGIVLRSQLESLLTDLPSSEHTNNGDERWSAMKARIKTLQTAELQDSQTTSVKRNTLRLIAASLPTTDKAYTISLNDVMNRSPFVVHKNFRLNLTKIFFQSLGIRHLIVVEGDYTVCGIITRKDLVKIDEDIRKDSVSDIDSSDEEGYDPPTLIGSDAPDRIGCSSSPSSGIDSVPREASVEVVADSTLPQLPTTQLEHAPVVDSTNQVDAEYIPAAYDEVSSSSKSLYHQIPDHLFNDQVFVSEVTPEPNGNTAQIRPTAGSQTSLLTNSDVTYGRTQTTGSVSSSDRDRGRRSGYFQPSAPKRNFVSSGGNPLQYPHNDSVGVSSPMPFAIDISRFQGGPKREQGLWDPPPDVSISVTEDNLLGGVSPSAKITDETLRSELRDLMQLVGIGKPDSHSPKYSYPTSVDSPVFDPEEVVL
eukprot:TRINITY_DN1159_c3_g1_i1.p1 TRINITY_DN1159_c3_g1~~TRINITY_DN1159_c3_g1_i1.p1  ORF type:complete len:1075 (+),score=181.98 TRINITY_DN1159_c3_g1_i1:93-3317(+)